MAATQVGMRLVAESGHPYPDANFRFIPSDKLASQNIPRSTSLGLMAKHLDITRINGQFHIEGYPDAVALKRIDTPVARQLQATTLHLSDLLFCETALEQLTQLESRHGVIPEALWVAAIARFFKCFGNSESRAQLSEKKILKSHAGAHDVFGYFKNLRDKHLIHDESALTQGFTGVAVNAVGAQYQVADIIAMSFNAFTIDDAHLVQFRQLVNVTLAWLRQKQEDLHNLLGAEYEKWARDDLLALPDITYTVPGSDAVSTKREG
nr:hypothetical protein [Rhodoferax sp.]